MRERSLWRALMGLELSVVEGVVFDEAAGEVVVHVRPVARVRGRCGRCRVRSPVYDQGRGRRRWRGLDLGLVTAFVEAEAPRVNCPTHGVVVAHVPWARHDAGHTLGFDQTIAWLATVTSKQAVTELMRIAWRTVGSIITRVWADTGGLVDRFAGLRRIGIDEISYRRGRLFLTVVIDHDTGHVVWVGVGQSKATLQRFFDALGSDRCQLISHVSADSAQYIADAVAENCLEAVQVADPFHVVKWANDALGEVRLQAWREAKAMARVNSRGRGRSPADAGAPMTAAERSRILSRSRYALWKNPENLTAGQQAKLEWIAKTDPRLYRGYQLKEGLRAVFQLPLAEAEEVLDRWCRSAAACRIPQFVDLAATVRRQRAPILAAIEHRLSNARTESVNTKIRLRTRMAFGFKNPDALIALILLSLGGHRPVLPGRT